MENVVYANLLAALNPQEQFEVFNTALGGRITLNELHEELSRSVNDISGVETLPAKNGPARAGDIQTSRADIFKIQQRLGFQPVIEFDKGIRKTVEWFFQNPSE